MGPVPAQSAAESVSGPAPLASSLPQGILGGRGARPVADRVKDAPVGREQIDVVARVREAEGAHRLGKHVRDPAEEDRVGRDVHGDVGARAGLHERVLGQSPEPLPVRQRAPPQRRGRVAAVLEDHHLPVWAAPRVDGGDERRRGRGRRRLRGPGPLRRVARASRPVALTRRSRGLSRGRRPGQLGGARPPGRRGGLDVEPGHGVERDGHAPRGGGDLHTPLPALWGRVDGLARPVGQPGARAALGIEQRDVVASVVPRGRGPVARQAPPVPRPGAVPHHEVGARLERDPPEHELGRPVAVGERPAPQVGDAPLCTGDVELHELGGRVAVGPGVDLGDYDGGELGGRVPPAASGDGGDRLEGEQEQQQQAWRSASHGPSEGAEGI
jgi:hypothetical protein